MYTSIHKTHVPINLTVALIYLAWSEKHIKEMTVCEAEHGRDMIKALYD